MLHDPGLMARIEAATIPEPNSGCLLWTGYATPLGYGILSIKNRNYLAHRLTYQLRHGAIPAGLIACHKCDNPGCVNPDHIFIGTQADNARDMLQKGRENRDPRPYHWGQRNPNSRITDETVRAILLSPLNQREAAATFGVAPSWVQRIRKREVWRHVEVPAHLMPTRKFFLKKKTRERLGQTADAGRLAGGEVDGRTERPSHPSPATMQKRAA